MHGLNARDKAFYVDHKSLSDFNNASSISLMMNHFKE